MKRYILWDNDGVLVDTEHWYFKATQRALGELGVHLDEETYQERMVRGASSWELAAQAGIDPERIVAKRQQRDAYYQAHLAQETIEIPGVEGVLAKLARNSNVNMAIVTTSTRAHFDLIHRKRNLLRFMDFVLTREDYVSSKPDPEPYLLALSRFGARADECLVVEDSQRGLQAAIAAGIDCAVVHNAFTASHDFTGATHLLGSIHDLPGIIANPALARAVRP
ncbi:MAG TPA: HAD family phosphatase [Dehalococcoidia bacterium]|nr:HAD family phosphatase [Dehalococcoidia bacterium]